MKQTNLSSIFPQTKHHPSQPQSNLCQPFGNNIDNDGTSEIDNHPYELFNSKLHSDKKNNMNSKQQSKQTINMIPFSHQVVKQQQINEGITEGNEKISAIQGKRKSHINKNNKKKRQSSVKGGAEQHREKSEKKKSIAAAMNIAQAISLTQQPTQASTVITTKKRIEAPKTLHQIQQNLKENSDIDLQSKSRFNRTKNRDQIKDQNMKECSVTIDQATALIDDKINHRKRKIQGKNISFLLILIDISNEEENQRPLDEEIIQSKKRKLNEEEKIPEEIQIQTRNLQEYEQQQPKIKKQSAAKANTIIAGLSSSTRELMKKALEARNQTLQVNATPIKDQQKRKPQKKIQLQQDITFDELKVQDSPPQENQFSQSTLQIIKEIQNESNKQTQGILSNLMKSYEDIMKEELSMKLKHSELLSVTRELVMPAHYKILLDIQGYLDNSLNFLKQCRNQGGIFPELKRSIEKTYGKRFEIENFRQILTIAPELYTYKWEQFSQYNAPQLYIDFNYTDDLIAQGKLDERQKLFKQKLFEYCKKYYDAFIEKLKNQRSQSIDTDIDMGLDFDPFKEQMWHHLFDPHSLEPIPQTELKLDTKFQKQRSESVKDFLNKSNIQKSLVQQALEKSMIINKEEKKDDEPDNKELQKLRALSQKTGLSIETLRLIKAKESAIKQSQNIMGKNIALEENQKKCQQLTKVADQIRSLMAFRNLGSLYMKDLISSLNDTQRGNFISSQELSALVPEWLQIKDFKGKLVKITKSISSQQVQTWINQRITDKEKQQEDSNNSQNQNNFSSNQ